MKREQCVIFDLDGTILDSRAVTISAFESAHREVLGSGSEPPTAAFLARMGASFENVCAALGLPPAMKAAFAAQARARVAQLRVFPGIEQSLQRLHNSRLPLALLTGKDRLRTEEILERFGLTRLFKAVVTGTDQVRAKPAPDAIRWIQRELSCPVACLIGDAPFDMMASRAAGVTALGCSWGFFSGAELLRHGASVILDYPEQIVRHARAAMRAGASSTSFLPTRTNPR